MKIRYLCPKCRKMTRELDEIYCMECKGKKPIDRPDTSSIVTNTGKMGDQVAAKFDKHDVWRCFQDLRI